MNARIGLISLALLIGCVSPNLSAAEAPKVRLQLQQSHLTNPVLSDSDAAPESQFFKDTGAAAVDETAKPSSRKGWYQDVYPGIDLVLYGDDSNLEYLFVVNPGADPSLISFSMEGQTSQKNSSSGSISMGIANGEISMTKPVVTVTKDGQTQTLNSGFTTQPDGSVNVDLRAYTQEKNMAMNGSQFNVVKGGGQPGGPQYDFYVAKNELSNEQLLTFLNALADAASDPGGSTTFIDPSGNVWMNPRMKPQSDELFNMKNSKVTYDPKAKPGKHFAHQKGPDGKTTTYAQNPASGLSWYGSVKYCNWVTLRSGRGASELCYTEGSEPTNWAPVTATNWASGNFGKDERAKWVKMKGFRLPMLDADPNKIEPSPFNEFYKASAWDSVTNRQRGPASAVAKGNGTVHQMPNYYGLFDVGGTHSEWLNDPGSSTNSTSRAAAGGNADDATKPLSKGTASQPYDTSGTQSMRPITTYMPKETLTIHVLFSFYMTPKEKEQTSKSGENVSVDSGTAKTGDESTEGLPNEPTGPSASDNKSTEEPSTTPATSEIIPSVVTYTVPPDEAVAADTTTTTTTIPPTSTPTSTPTTPTTTEPSVTPPVTPPDNTERKVRLSVFSVNPDSGVDIEVSSSNLANNVTTPTAFTMKFPTGSTVTIVAPQYSPSGSVFDHWDSGHVTNGIFKNGNVVMNASDPDIVSSSQAYMFTIAGSNLSFTAVYRSSLTLTVGSISPDSGVGISVSPPDVVSSQSDGQTEFQRHYWPGTSITLTAPTNAPGTGNAFHHWLIDSVSTSLTRTVTFTINADMRADAVFAPHLLRIRSSAPGSGISVSVFPTDYYGDGSDVTAFDLYYDDNVVVSVTAPATAPNGNVFQNWLVDNINVGTNLTTSIVMGGDHLVMAVYAYMPTPITDPTVSPGGI